MAIADGLFFFGVEDREEEIRPSGYSLFTGQAGRNGEAGKHHPGEPTGHGNKPARIPSRLPVQNSMNGQGQRRRPLVDNSGQANLSGKRHRGMDGKMDVCTAVIDERRQKIDGDDGIP
jgi:hypothetical protein